MTQPRISVAMSVYNNARFLAPAIESILAQTLGDFEFLIVNDGSSDGSGAIIDDFAARDHRIRPIHQENRGLITSLNRMIEEAGAPLIARMDGDDIAEPERFARQVAFLEAHPDHGVVGTNTNDLDEAGRFYICDDAIPLDDQAVRAAFESGCAICHPSAMVRADLLRSVGGYRTAYRHCEDYDLWLRLSERTKMANLRERLLLYRRSPEQVSNRHALALQYGAAVAWIAHCERMAGRPDPTDGLETLPDLDGLDRLFGRSGIADEVRQKVALGIVYSESALSGPGLDIILDHVRQGGARSGLWRTVPRLLTFGHPQRALRLSMALAIAEAGTRLLG